jgi:hypothetical protein
MNKSLSFLWINVNSIQSVCCHAKLKATSKLLFENQTLRDAMYSLWDILDRLMWNCCLVYLYRLGYLCNIDRRNVCNAASILIFTGRVWVSLWVYFSCSIAIQFSSNRCHKLTLRSLTGVGAWCVVTLTQELQDSRLFRDHEFASVHPTTNKYKYFLCSCKAHTS